ncbi:MAG: hypothetical protein OEM02_06990 [Desulfobulbaceae bacterium]|nr:hypothetical protein [Desulfobulbaceae bacterium]
MQKKRVLQAERVRKINGSFAFIEHQFLRQGFWSKLSHDELVLYFFLVLVADREGLSFYGKEKICSYCGFSPEEYLVARNNLIQKNLIAFNKQLFQVLSLPVRLPAPPKCFLENHEPTAANAALTALQSLKILMNKEKAL